LLGSGLHHRCCRRLGLIRRRRCRSGVRAPSGAVDTDGGDRFLPAELKPSPTLYGLCRSGAHLESGTLTVRKAGGDAFEDRVVKMEHVLITGLQTTGSDGQDQIVEQVTLDFKRVGLVYTPQLDPDTEVAPRHRTSGSEVASDAMAVGAIRVLVLPAWALSSGQLPPA
jgi:hypothetical protein